MIVQLISLGVALAVIAWFWRRADREFRRGYLLALDHVQNMSGRGLTRRELPDTLRLLRAEMGLENEGGDT